VTKFTLNAYPIGQVWGGLVTYDVDQIDQVLQATSDFAANNTDLDAGIVTFIVSANKTLSLLLNIFYNSPSPPSNGVFDGFLSIANTSSDVTTRSFLDFVIGVSGPTLNPGHLRGQQSTVSIPELTMPVLHQMAEQTKVAQIDSGIALVWLEPVIPSSVIRENISASAYPHSSYFTSLMLIGLWPDAAEDAKGVSAVKQANAAIEAAVRADHQDNAGLVQYPNHAIGDVPASEIFGPNLPRLEALVKLYDPEGIMKRTGGFKIF